MFLTLHQLWSKEEKSVRIFRRCSSKAGHSSSMWLVFLGLHNLYGKMGQSPCRCGEGRHLDNCVPSVDDEDKQMPIKKCHSICRTCVRICTVGFRQDLRRWSHDSAQSWLQKSQAVQLQISCLLFCFPSGWNIPLMLDYRQSRFLKSPYGWGYRLGLPSFHLLSSTVIHCEFQGQGIHLKTNDSWCLMLLEYLSTLLRIR